MLPGLLNDGEAGEIGSLAPPDGALGETRAEDMELRVGKHVEMLSTERRT